jgi:hypothetical protein
MLRSRPAYLMQSCSSLKKESLVSDSCNVLTQYRINSVTQCINRGVQWLASQLAVNWMLLLLL